MTKADDAAEEKKESSAGGETATVSTEEVTMGESENANKDTAEGDAPEGKPQRGPAHDRMAVRGIKSKFDNLEESSDANEIREQVEFYFADSNLPTDAHMLKLTGGHENKPVDVAVIHSFKRMAHFQPRSAVVNALKESEILNISDDGGITRKVPLDSKYTGDAFENKSIQHLDNMTRSIYAKGFSTLR